MGRGASSAPARSIKARAIQLLAQREHSRAELRRKLLAHALAESRHADAGQGALEATSAGEAGEPGEHDEHDEPVVRDVRDVLARLDALLDWLEAHHYLSQQRFVESRVHARASRFGNLRIHQELARHEVGLSAEAASALKGTEFARAQAVWQRKFGGRASGLAEHAKQARFLAGRGFTADVIRHVLRDAAAPAVENTRNSAPDDC